MRRESCSSKTIVMSSMSLLLLVSMAWGAAAQAVVVEKAEDVPLANSKAHIYKPGTEARPEGPIRLAPGPHLLIDGYLIESSSNVRRVVNGPKRDP